MAMLFRKDPEEDDLEEFDDDEAGSEFRAPAEVPEFALIVSDVSTDGWHMAAVIGESGNPDFYVRAVSVGWPFQIARPAPSNRIRDKPVDPHSLSPARTTPAYKLVVNWAWIPVDDSAAQLRFYAKRAAARLFRSPGPLKVRLTLKESGWPRRRIVVPLKSNGITWNPSAPGKPASPPRKSTGTDPA